MNEIGMAWAAGIFEGEGTFSAPAKASGRRHLHMAVSSTDEDVIRRFHATVGVGTVAGPYRRPDFRQHHKPAYIWRASGNGAMTLLGDQAFASHLCGRRRARLTELLAILDAQPPPFAMRLGITHCPEGHEYTTANTYHHPSQRGRRCRQCRNTRAQDRRNRKKLEAL